MFVWLYLGKTSKINERRQMFNVKDIEILSKHIEIVHHAKGRVRLKIDTKIANSGISLGLEDFENLSKNLKGMSWSPKIKQQCSEIKV